MNQQSIGKVRYTHDAVIDEILRDPSVSQKDLAKAFGFSQTAMSIIVNSDAFKERLAERKGFLVDPVLAASLNERLDAVARRSMERIMERLDSPAPIKDADLVSMAKLGVGDKNNRIQTPQTQNNLYVIQAPLPAKNSTEWLGAVSQTPRPLEIVQEVNRG